MGRTLPPITQTFLQEQETLSRLGRGGQQALDDLFVVGQKRLAAQAAQALPLETFLMVMLLEEHKEVMRLRNPVERTLFFRPGAG